MAIKFVNIRSKEVRVAETEPMISAMWASSDRSPNVSQGQDFGWRLAPEVVVEMERITQDITTMERISARYSKPLEDIKEPDILQWISEKTAPANAPQGNAEDSTDEYHAEIRRLREEGGLIETSTTTTTTKSVAELEAELAQRKAAEQPEVTTTTSTTEQP
jgi:hypothetical protein